MKARRDRASRSPPAAHSSSIAAGAGASPARSKGRPGRAGAGPAPLKEPGGGSSTDTPARSGHGPEGHTEVLTGLGHFSYEHRLIIPENKAPGRFYCRGCKRTGE